MHSAVSEWHPLPSKVGQTAAVAFAVLALVAAAGWLYILGQPVSIGSLIAFLIGTSAGVLALAMAVLALGYYSMRYRLEPNRLVISCLWLREFVPLGQIEGIGGGKRLGSRAVVEGIAWQGLSIGRLIKTELTMPLVYATSLNPEQVLVVTTSHRSYVFSPADRSGFRSRLIEELESLPEDAVESAPEPTSEGSILPFTSVASDRVCLWLGLASLVALLVCFAYVAVKLSGLPEVIPLHFNSAGLPDFTVSRADAFRLPLIGTLVLLANAVVVAAVHSWQRDAGRVMVAATLFVEVVALISLVRVVQ